MDERLRKVLKIKNKYLRWGCTALLAAAFAFADFNYLECFLSGVVFPLGGIFLGPAAVVGFVVGTGLAYWIWAKNITMLFYVLSAFCVSFVPWLLRRYLKNIKDPGIIIRYYLVMALSVLICIALTALCYLLPSDDPDMFYDVSIGMGVMSFGYPIGFPLYYLFRSLLDKNIRERSLGVRMLCLWMPVQFGVSAWFASRAFAISDASDIFVQWFVMDIVLTVFFGITAVFVWLFCKRKRLMLNIFTIILTLSAIYNFFHFDAGLGTYILAFISVWLAVHAIYFPAYERKMSGSKPFKTTVRAAQSMLAILFTLIVALSAAGYAIPMANGDESGMIILGAPVRDDQASDILNDRINAAADFLNRYEAMPVIATGGTKVAGRKTEAQVITEGLERQGVSPDRIAQETQAKTTQENFINCAEMIRQAGGSGEDPYIIATSQFHMLRSGLYARNAGFTNLRFLGAPSFIMKSLTWYIREVLAILPLVF